MNPLKKGNKSKSPTPPLLNDQASLNSNPNAADLEQAEVDTMDFTALLQDDEDLNTLNVPPSAFDAKSFGQYSLDIDMDDLGDVKSVFASVQIDPDKFKKKAPPKKEKKHAYPTPAAPNPSAAPLPAGAAPMAAAAPLPGGAPMAAPLPGAAPMAAPLPGGAPMAAAAAPMAAVAPVAGGAPMAPVAPMAVAAPSASIAPAAAAAPLVPATQVELSDAERENVAAAKSQFANVNANAVPLLASGQARDEFVRPEDYDKEADVAYSKDASLLDKQNQAQQLADAGKVSQFSGLQSSRNVVSTASQEQQHLQKAKGKVTQFTGLEQSTRKIVTADEEEQKRLADSKLVKKQKSMFSGLATQQSKRTSLVHGKEVTDAASAAKNKFRAMEKQNTQANINQSSRKLKTRKTKKNINKT